MNIFLKLRIHTFRNGLQEIVSPAWQRNPTVFHTVKSTVPATNSRPAVSVGVAILPVENWGQFEPGTRFIG